MTFISGEYVELGKLYSDAKYLIKRLLKKGCTQEKGTNRDPMRLNINALYSGGSTCISEEAAVMAVERRS